MHVAAAEYADHVTAAFGTYQHALADLVKDANEKELAALPAELDSGDAADRPAAIEETFQRWRSAIDEGQDAMLRGVSAAQRELAEVWQRSWLDLVDKHAEANRQYQRARADALGPEQAITAPAPFVAGDEGLAIPPQAPGWAGWAAPWTAQWGT